MKIKTIIPFNVLFLIFLTSNLNAQSYISIASGVSRDMNNTISFYHVPLSVQWKPGNNPRSPIIFQVDYYIPLTGNSTGNAYTLNPSLPEKQTLQENIRAGIFTFSMGFAIHLYTNKKNNSFQLNLLMGLCAQNFKVIYKDYDKVNYEVLNPDINLNSGGFVLSSAGVYNFNNKKMFLMLQLQTPPIQTTGDYPLSYKFIAPLQFTYGYKLFFKRRK